MRDLQRVIGDEAAEQVRTVEGRLPDIAMACVGGGSNAIGLLARFIGETGTRLVGVEAAGEGLTGRHAAALAGGTPGVLHGSRSYLLQDEDGQVTEAHSISAGLDYPGIGPQLSALYEAGRLEILSATDDEALEGVRLLTRTEGILPALEPAHAIHALIDLLAGRGVEPAGLDDIILLGLSGRGDKDIAAIEERLMAGSRRGAWRERRPEERSRGRQEERGRRSEPVGRRHHPVGRPCPHPRPLSSRPPRLDEPRSSPMPWPATRTRRRRCASRVAQIDAGADLLEIGLPYSDPLADGATLQRASTVALRHGARLDDSIELVGRIHAARPKTPLVAMGYVNQVLGGRDGATVLRRLGEAGVCGFILADLTPDEGAELEAEAARHGIGIVYLVAPTTPVARRAYVASRSQGFLYAVSLAGVTGARKRLPPGVRGFLRDVRSVSPVPVAVGFGVSKPAHARELARRRGRHHRGLRARGCAGAGRPGHRAYGRPGAFTA